MSDTIKVWCLLFARDLTEKNIGDIFLIECSRDSYVATLKDVVKKAREDALRDMDARHLLVWRGRNPTLCTKNALAFIRSIDFSDKEVVERLWEMDKLVLHLLGEEEVLLVERPGVAVILFSSVSNADWALKNLGVAER